MHSPGLSKYRISCSDCFVLTSYSLVTHGKVSDIITKILFQHQRCLTNYQYHSQAGEIPPVTALNTDPLARVTSVGLHLISEDDCRKAASILARTPDVTELSIIFGNEWEQRLPSSFAPICRDFMDILFNMKGTKRQLSRLRSLSLEQFTLTLSGPI